MEGFVEIDQVLPTDDELLRRENIFLDLFNKYVDIDDESDPVPMDDVDDSAASFENSDAASSCSQMSSNGTEDAFDVDEMTQRVQSIVADRVDAWPEKGINFQLKTVDRNVTVVQWLEANREFTTTTKNYKKTVVNEKNAITTITTETTKTTTSRRSFFMFRNEAEASNENQLQAITNQATSTSELPKDDNDIKKETKRPKKKPSSEPRKQSSLKVNRKVNRKNIDASSPPEIKRLLSPRSPQMKLSKRRIATRATSKTKNRNTQSEEVVANGDFVPADVLDSHVRKESDRATGNFRTKYNSLFKTRPHIIIYSPSAKEAFGTKIDDEFMSVKKDDFVKRIDPKYHQQQDFSAMEECIVPINQRIVYEPPSIDGPTMENDADDSEIEDDLLTSYTRTGHFFLLNSKRPV